MSVMPGFMAPCVPVRLGCVSWLPTHTMRACRDAAALREKQKVSACRTLPVLHTSIQTLSRRKRRNRRPPRQVEGAGRNNIYEGRVPILPQSALYPRCPHGGVLVGWFSWWHVCRRERCDDIIAHVLVRFLLDLDLFTCIPYGFIEHAFLTYHFAG